MHPEIDRYAGLDSPLHRWDPGLKICGLSLYVCAIASLSHWTSAAAAIAISLALVQISAIAIGDVLRRLSWVIFCLLPFVALIPLGLEAESPRRLVWDPQQIPFAVTLALRALAIAIAFFPMWGTAPLHRTVRSLADLGAPASGLQLFLFCYRYLFVSLDHMRRLRIALAARCFRPRLRWHTARTYAHQAGMLLVLSCEQTERILMAMKARGYQGRIHTLEAASRDRTDWAKLALAVAVSLLLVAGDRLAHPPGGN
ncbi:MAG: energy-coupling factor transporter transmembrane protein EcfT [Planctomycetota bacterium]